MIVLACNQVDNRSDSAPDESEFLSLEVEQWLQDAFPEFYPTVPSLDHRSVNLDIPSPFSKDGEARHPKLREKKSAMSADGAVNGLSKFHTGSSDGIDKNSVETPFDRFPPERRSAATSTGLWT